MLLRFLWSFDFLFHCSWEINTSPKFIDLYEHFYWFIFAITQEIYLRIRQAFWLTCSAYEQQGNLRRLQALEWNIPTIKHYKNFSETVILFPRKKILERFMTLLSGLRSFERRLRFLSVKIMKDYFIYGHIGSLFIWEKCLRNVIEKAVLYC